MHSTFDPTAFREALIILAATAFVIPLFHRLRASPLLGFIVVGMALGPFGLGGWTQQLPWLSYISLSDRERIAPFAEFGVVLLLFMIGLELSFARLRSLARFVFGLGLVVFILAAAGVAAIAAVLGAPPAASAILGLSLGMSSTAVVIGVLAEAERLLSPVGRLCFAVLLLQDLAVVPILFVLGTPHFSLSGFGTAGLAAFAVVLAQAVGTVLGTILLGRIGLRPLFRSVARTKSPELLMAAVFLVVLATGLAMAAAQLSMALGALIAGLLLSETEYRHQVAVMIAPFKGLLLGVFLVAVGMSLDLRLLFAEPLTVLSGLVGLITLKAALTAILARVVGIPWAIGLQAGMLLGPGGEFGFVIVSTGASHGMIDPSLAGVALLLVALSMALVPPLHALGLQVEKRTKKHQPADAALFAPSLGDVPKVIIAGFGRVGRIVADLLSVHRIPYVAIDRDADLVARARAEGCNAYFGDLTDPELLRQLQLSAALALVVTLDNPRVADQLIVSALRLRPDMCIVARARDAAHAAHLYRLGAFDAVPETIEASLQLAEAVLVDVGIPMGPVIASIHEKRAAIQAEIKARAPEATPRPLSRPRLRDLNLKQKV
jgi:CPA2 family monovalent cation:H+ antiporter-2